MRLKTRLIKQDFAAVTEAVIETAKVVNTHAKAINDVRIAVDSLTESKSTEAELRNRGLLGRVTWLITGK